MQDTITNTPQPTFSSGLGNFYFNIKYDDCYPFIFTNIKGPILVKDFQRLSASSLVNLFISNPPLLNYEHPKCPLFLNFILPD